MGEESAVEGVVSSASTQLPLCLDAELLRNTGGSVLSLDGNFWSNRQEIKGFCVGGGKKCTLTCVTLLILMHFVSDGTQQVTRGTTQTRDQL